MQNNIGLFFVADVGKLLFHLILQDVQKLEQEENGIRGRIKI